MHVSRLDGSWNETDSDFKVRFPSSSELFANDMMPKDQLTTANDIDCKMALTVIESQSDDIHINRLTLSFSLVKHSEAVSMMILRQLESWKLQNSKRKE